MKNNEIKYQIKSMIKSIEGLKDSLCGEGNTYHQRNVQASNRVKKALEIIALKIASMKDLYNDDKVCVAYIRSSLLQIEDILLDVEHY